jgi:hypothetical protein
MNAFRKIRILTLVALLALVVFGIGAATAEAGYHCGYKYASYSPSYCYYPSYNYCNYDYSCFYPKCSYPVTVYDCFGRPYTVWQTGYGSVPVNYLP